MLVPVQLPKCAAQAALSLAQIFALNNSTIDQQIHGRSCIVIGNEQVNGIVSIDNSGVELHGISILIGILFLLAASLAEIGVQGTIVIVLSIGQSHIHSNLVSAVILHNIIGISSRGLDELHSLDARFSGVDGIISDRTGLGGNSFVVLQFNVLYDFALLVASLGVVEIVGLGVPRTWWCTVPEP